MVEHVITSSASSIAHGDAGNKFIMELSAASGSLNA